MMRFFFLLAMAQMFVWAADPISVRTTNGVAYGLRANGITVNPLAYDATTWNGSTNVPTRDDIRDKLETLTGAPSGTVVNSGASVANAVPRYIDTTGTNVQPSGVTITATNMSVIGDIYANKVYSTNGFEVTGVAASELLLRDNDQSHSIRFVPASTTVTNVNLILPDRPYSGHFYATISGGTNVTLTYGPKITTKTTAYTVLESDMGAHFNNTGATAKVALTLPAAAAGMEIWVAVTDADGFDIISVGDDIFLYGTTVSAGAATITSTTRGSTIHLVAHDATQWVAEGITGTWTP